ncbi:MAG: FlgD immunoglobulin-like domain containing protein [Candidatus Neomarinimicrobiota bacterium]
MRLTVYDILGREVRQLVDRPFVSGYHQTSWDGHTALGAAAPTGVYFARISAADYRQTIKMLLLK